MMRGHGNEQPRAMVIAGVMSGTSADGVDVAVVRVSAGANAMHSPRIELIGHRSFPYSAALREHILAAMDAQSISVAELARLNWRLGAIYADAVAQTCAELHVSTPADLRESGDHLELIGLHGQTIYHQASTAEYAGADVSATWQIGEAAVLRERLGVPVISDFRPADLAAGGQGAPLVPMLDFCLFRSSLRNRVLLNLGGIANVSVIAAGAQIEQVLAFDTGPANMVIDALMGKLYGKPYDLAGEVAARGTALPTVLEALLAAPYFRAPPPKSCGREQFGANYAEGVLRICHAQNASSADTIATTTELTIRSIVRAFNDFCAPALRESSAAGSDLIVAGGGARNTFLLDRLTAELDPHQVTVLLADDFGVPSEAKEAVAFAFLAWLSWNQRPGNIPNATGASHAAVLGKVTC